MMRYRVHWQIDKRQLHVVQIAISALCSKLTGIHSPEEGILKSPPLLGGLWFFSPFV